MKPHVISHGLMNLIEPSSSSAMLFGFIGRVNSSYHQEKHIMCDGANRIHGSTKIFNRLDDWTNFSITINSPATIILLMMPEDPLTIKRCRIGYHNNL